MERFKKGILSGVFFFVPLISFAQNLYLPDMHESIKRFVASGSNNPAFLTEFPLQRVSYLQAFAAKGDGDFVNYNQSDNSYQAGLATESYYRFNNRIMLYGKMSYGLDRGKNMAGSAFIPFDNLPFDLVEMTDTCAGRKKLETYTLSGAIGYRLDDKFALGAKVFYQASNYAKFKDLRHQNSQMHLKLNAGANYNIGSKITVGLSYMYDRKNEALEFDIYGNTDKQYETLIDFGGFFGRKEVFGESGYTAESTPLFTETHGGALQIELRPGKNINWFNEIVYNNANGRFGSGDDRDIIFSTHKGNVIGYNGKLLLQHNKDAHIIELVADKQKTDNFENNYKESTDENGISQIFYYGKNKVLDRDRWDAALSYTFYKDADAIRSKFNAGGRFAFSSMKSTTSVYPFYRKQTINNWQSDIYATYNWFKNNQVFTLSMMLGYGSGGGKMKDDGVYADVSDDQKLPDNRDDLLVKQYDFLTASRISGRLSLGYERNILKNLSAYAVAEVSPRYALNSSLKETSFVQFDVQIGVKF